MHPNDLNFILNYLVNYTDQVDLFKARLKEYTKGNQDYINRINNLLDLLKID